MFYFKKRVIGLKNNQQQPLAIPHHIYTPTPQLVSQAFPQYDLIHQLKHFNSFYFLP